MGSSIAAGSKVVAVRAVGVGRLMRQAIYANDLARYDHVSKRISAGRDAAAQHIVRVGGTLHACPSFGGNSFFAQVPAQAAQGRFIDDLELAFLTQARYMRPGVGLGDDLRSAVDACERDVEASPRPDLSGLGPPRLFPTVPHEMQVVSTSVNEIGRAPRRAIETNRMSEVDAFSDRVSAGMDAALRLVRGVGGTIYGAGSDNLCAVIRPNTIDVEALKERFECSSAGLTMAVGVGADLRSSYINLATGGQLYLALVWHEALEGSFEDDFRLR